MDMADDDVPSNERSMDTHIRANNGRAAVINAILYNLSTRTKMRPLANST